MIDNLLYNINYNCANVLKSARNVALFGQRYITIEIIIATAISPQEVPH